jgi:hypothetical protein
VFARAIDSVDRGDWAAEGLPDPTTNIESLFAEAPPPPPPVVGVEDSNPNGVSSLQFDSSGVGTISFGDVCCGDRAGSPEVTIGGTDRPGRLAAGEPLMRGFFFLLSFFVCCSSPSLESSKCYGCISESKENEEASYDEGRKTNPLAAGRLFQKKKKKNEFL